MSQMTSRRRKEEVTGKFKHPWWKKTRSNSSQPMAREIPNSKSLCICSCGISRYSLWHVAFLTRTISFKWRIFSQPGKIGTGKNTKSLFFLLGLKFTLRTCFESKNFSSNSCPELSNQLLSFSACQIWQYFTKMAGYFYSNFWHLMVKFGHNEWF